MAPKCRAFGMCAFVGATPRALTVLECVSALLAVQLLCMVDAQWPGRTCADSNGDGTADDWHDCSAHANDLDGSPEGIMCAADPCTDTECCTVAPHAGGDGSWDGSWDVACSSDSDCDQAATEYCDLSTQTCQHLSCTVDSDCVGHPCQGDCLCDSGTSTCRWVYWMGFAPAAEPQAEPSPAPDCTCPAGQGV